MTENEQMIETTLGAVLTHTTGVLLDEMDEVWILQDAIVGRPLMTHERTDMFAPNATLTRDFLLRQFPLLAEAQPPKLSGKDECLAWVASVSAHTGYPLRLTIDAPTFPPKKN